MSILQSIEDIVKFLESSGYNYAVIGGIAVLLHGGRASTIDFDLYILGDHFSGIEKHLTANGCVVTMRGEHQLRMTFSGVAIDLLEADPILGARIFKRTVRRRIVSTECNVATPEDIIVLKTLADRPIDRRDIVELREIFADTLDESYIAKMLNQIEQNK